MGGRRELIDGASIVIPTHNRAETILRAVSSVLAQQPEPLEVLIVDDGSEDETREVVEGVGDPKVRYIEQPHSGVGSARNRGLAEVSGGWVTFLDSDDEALPGWLATFSEELSRPGVEAVCCGVWEQLGSEMTAVLPSHRAVPAFGGPALFLAGSFACRTELLRSMGGYCEDLTYGENTELGLRLVRRLESKHRRLAIVERPLVVYHRRKEGWRASPERLKGRLRSSTLLLDRHRVDLRARDPSFLADWAATAGVRAMRLGEIAAARAFFVEAVQAQPLVPRHYARLLVGLWPQLARRVWGAAGEDGA